MSKRLNFFPYYDALLRTGQKTTTFRLTNREGFEIGDEVDITLGWDLDSAQVLRPAEITDVYQKRISELNGDDFEGESPDCKEPFPTALVLGAIYRTVVDFDDVIWVVKFRYPDA